HPGREWASSPGRAWCGRSRLRFLAGEKAAPPRHFFGHGDETDEDLRRIVPRGAEDTIEPERVRVRGEDTGAVRTPGDILAVVALQFLARHTALILSKPVGIDHRASPR